MARSWPGTERSNGVHPIPEEAEGAITAQQARWWLAGAGAALLAVGTLGGAAYRWVVAPIADLHDQMASVKSDVAVVKSDLAAHYALDQVEQESLIARVARVEAAVDLANQDPRHAP
jgi:hypothetical protein